MPDALWPSFQIARFQWFLGQFYEFPSKWYTYLRFAPPTSPGGGSAAHPAVPGMPIALAVAVSFHNLVPRDGIIGMQWEYFTKLLGLFSNFFLHAGGFYMYTKKGEICVYKCRGI